MEKLNDDLHELVTRNAGLAWHIAKKWARSGLDVEDLAQVGLIGLMKAAQAYEPEKGRFATYATWWCRAVIRRHAEKALKHRGLASLDAMEADVRDDAEGPADELIDAEQHARIWSAVGRLQAKDREVIALRYWDGLNQQKAADRLGCTRTRVYQRELRALGRLRAALAG